MEQFPLFPERFILLINMGSSNLERHILIRNFGNIGDEEDGRQTENKDPNGQVHPLHTLQGSYGVGGVGEEGIRAQHGADDRPDRIEGLGEVDSDFGIAGRAAD